MRIKICRHGTAGPWAVATHGTNATITAKKMAMKLSAGSVSFS